MKLDRLTAAALLVVVCVAALASVPKAASAQSAVSDVFAVTVPVDAKAQSALAARELARTEGQRRAFRQLLERLTLPADRGRLPRVDDATLTAMVQDISVANERTSAVRYLAEYTYRFRPEEVRRRLRQANIPFAETPSKPVVLLPVLRRAGAPPALWDDPNPWRDAWGAERSSGGLVPAVLPQGDLADLGTVDAEKALAGNAKALGELAAKYGDGDPVVSAATARSDGDKIVALDVSTTRYGAAAAGPINQSFRANPGESEADFLARAVLSVKEGLGDAWKQQTMLRFGQESTLVVAVPLQDLGDWVAVRDRLNGVAAVRKAELVSLTKREARVELRFLGDPSQLRLALAQRDLVLAEGQPLWTLRRRAAAAAAGGR
jgi:hypothetical protein